MNIQNQLWPRKDADPGPDPNTQTTIPSVTLGRSFFAPTTKAKAVVRREDPGVWVDATLLHPRALELLSNAGLPVTGKWWRD